MKKAIIIAVAVFALAGCGGGGDSDKKVLTDPMFDDPVATAEATAGSGYDRHNDFMRQVNDELGVAAAAQKYGKWNYGWLDGWSLGYYFELGGPPWYESDPTEYCVHVEMDYSTGLSRGPESVQGCAEGIQDWITETPENREAWLTENPPSR